MLELTQHHSGIHAGNALTTYDTLRHTCISLKKPLEKKIILPTYINFITVVSMPNPLALYQILHLVKDVTVIRCFYNLQLACQAEAYRLLFLIIFPYLPTHSILSETLSPSHTHTHTHLSREGKEGRKEGRKQVPVKEIWERHHY